MCPPQTFSELLQNLNYSLPQLWPKSSAAVKIPENYLIMLTFPEFCAPTLLQTNVYNVAGYWPPTAQQDLPTRPLLLLFLPIFSQHTFTPLDHCQLDARVPVFVFVFVFSFVFVAFLPIVF